MNARADGMREEGIFTCPDWCARIEGGDEDHGEVAYATHIGAWTELVIDYPRGRTNMTVRMRPRAGWDDEDAASDQVEIAFTGRNAEPDPGSTDLARMLLNGVEWGSLDELYQQLWGQVTEWRNSDDGPWQWAYDGAEADAAAALAEAA